MATRFVHWMIHFTRTLPSQTRDLLELGEIITKVVNIGHLHGNTLYLRHLLQDLLLCEVLRVLHRGGEDASVSWSSKQVQDRVSDDVECLVEVHGPDVVVGPVRGHDGGEESVLGVGQSPELIINKVDEARLISLQHSETSDTRGEHGERSGR